MNDPVEAQGTAEHLANLLPRLTGETSDEFDGLGVDENNNIVMTADQAWLLYETALRSLPYCFAVGEFFPADEDCQMPTGICHNCAAAGRSLPTDHVARKRPDTGKAE